MKLATQPMPVRPWPVVRGPWSRGAVVSPTSAFTLVEIAISLAIIGFALVAIIGVLPIGLNVQRENREQTIINQDASVFMNAIRSGARGLDHLTNAVQGITVYRAQYDANTNMLAFYVRYYIPTDSLPAPPNFPLNDGFTIIGLLSMPKYVPLARGEFFSNHVVASVRAISGLATEKFPQDNPDVRQDAFSYRLITENVELPVPPAGPPQNTNSVNTTSRQLSRNLRELRLLFRWPLLASGRTGNGRQTFRTLVSGTLTNDPQGQLYTWFFQSQTFVKAAP